MGTREQQREIPDNKRERIGLIVELTVAECWLKARQDSNCWESLQITKKNWTRSGNNTAYQIPE